MQGCHIIIDPHSTLFHGQELVGVGIRIHSGFTVSIKLCNYFSVVLGIVLTCLLEAVKNIISTVSNRPSKDCDLDLAGCRGFFRSLKELSEISFEAFPLLRQVTPFP